MYQIMEHEVGFQMSVPNLMSWIIRFHWNDRINATNWFNWSSTRRLMLWMLCLEQQGRRKISRGEGPTLLHQDQDRVRWSWMMTSFKIFHLSWWVLVFLLPVLMSSLSIEAMADIFNEDEDGKRFFLFLPESLLVAVPCWIYCFPKWNLFRNR